MEDGRVRPYQGADEDSETGFVFAQLGALYVYDWKSACSAEGSFFNHRKFWEETGYGVVLRLDKRGAPNGVYVIWNFFDQVFGTGERYHVKTSDGFSTLNGIGQLHEYCGEEERFTLAKIAPDFSVLGEGYILSFEPKYQTVREHQIVRAMYVKGKAEDNIVVRQFVPQTEGREGDIPGSRGIFSSLWGKICRLVM